MSSSIDNSVQKTRVDDVTRITQQQDLFSRIESKACSEWKHESKEGMLVGSTCGNHVAIIDGANIELWDIAGKNCLWRYTLEAKSLSQCLVSSNGHILIVTDDKGICKIEIIKNGSVKCTISKKDLQDESVIVKGDRIFGFTKDTFCEWTLDGVLVKETTTDIYFNQKEYALNMLKSQLDTSSFSKDQMEEYSNLSDENIMSELGLLLAQFPTPLCRLESNDRYIGYFNNDKRSFFVFDLTENAFQTFAFPNQSGDVTNMTFFEDSMHYVYGQNKKDRDYKDLELYSVNLTSKKIDKITLPLTQGNIECLVRDQKQTAFVFHSPRSHLGPYIHRMDNDSLVLKEVDFVLMPLKIKLMLDNSVLISEQHSPMMSGACCGFGRPSALCHFKIVAHNLNTESKTKKDDANFEIFNNISNMNQTFCSYNKGALTIQSNNTLMHLNYNR